MSQEVEIIEGARGRSFSRVNRIKTDKQDGGACFWVPENERRLTSLPAFKNGEYEPGKGYYAFDSVDASVMHFDDFDINIDDYDLPHIDLDGIDITIDETGIPHINFDYEIVTVDDETIKVIYPDGKEVIIHGPDLDGLINIDDVFTIDYDKETGTWTITAIVDVTSGDNEFAPGDIVAQWPGTEHVDIHIGQSISIPDLGDIDLDFDADIDVSIDLDDMDVDISGIDMNGLDVDVNIDLDTLNTDTFDLPDEIRIMHVPNKTSYKDGEEIDLDGLVVQAYRNGEVWEDKEGKYWNGYIPVHELIISHSYNSPTYNTDSDGRIWNKASEIELESEDIYHYYLAEVGTRNIVGSFVTIDTVKTTIKTTGIENILIVGKEKLNDSVPYTGALAVGTCLDKNKEWKWFNQFSIYVRRKETSVSYAPEEYKKYPAFSESDNTYEGEITNTSEKDYVHIRNSAFIGPVYLTGSSLNPYHMGYDIRIGFAFIKEDYKYIVKEKDIDYSSSWVVPDGSSYRIYFGGHEHKNKCNVPVDYNRAPGTNNSTYLLTDNYYTNGVSGDKQLVSVSWPRPHDEKILTTSFEISVEEGATQTGGTTTSGDHGGSHSSGNF